MQNNILQDFIDINLSDKHSKKTYKRRLPKNDLKLKSNGSRIQVWICSSEKYVAGVPDGWHVMTGTPKL